jgi:hypothetical protein
MKRHHKKRTRNAYFFLLNKVKLRLIAEYSMHFALLFFIIFVYFTILFA